MKNVETSGGVPYPWKHHLLCIAPAALMVAVLWIVFRGETGVQRYFMRVRTENPTLTMFVRFWTDWGNVVFYAAYLALLIRSLRRPHSGGKRFVLAWLGAFALTLLVVYLFKGAVGRHRPFLDDRGFSPFNWGAGDDRHSFPSGHTTEALGSAIPLADRYRRRRFTLLLGLVAASVALTRMYLSMHFMSDIAGGLVMGSLCAYLTWRFGRRRGGDSRCAERAGA